MRYLLGLFIFCAWIKAFSLSVIYLTWVDDPTTTMMVRWHTGKEQSAPGLVFREVGEGDWRAAGGDSALIGGESYWVHTVGLEALRPGKTYEFRINGDKKVYRFRTMKKELGEGICFVVGGDAYRYLDLFCKMNAQIALEDPDFVVVGGDIAYTNGRRRFFQGKKGEMERWREFLKQWKRQMVTSDGRLIPIVPVIGNHDVRGSYVDPIKERLMFYEIFAFPQRGRAFRGLDFGNYLSLVLLDSGHTDRIAGEQTEWLESTLQKRGRIPYKMAIYHVGAYPSVYAYEGNTPTEIRKNWVPLLEQYGVVGAFEHHSHAYKRTYPIKAGKVDPAGVVYFGDGSWGVSPRRVRNQGIWYLANAQSENAVCVVRLSSEKAVVEALAIEGKVIDSKELLPVFEFIAKGERGLLKEAF